MIKKISLFILILLSAAIAIPLVQSMFFVQQTKGKIVIDKSINAEYLNSEKKEYQLVFYGYVGCTKVCSPVLERLNRFYTSEAFLKVKPYIGVTFVNLLPEVSKEQPDLYAKSFNKDFSGIYLSQKELMALDRELNVFFAKNLSNSFEIDHSDHVYLIKRDKDGKLFLINLYTTHPLNESLIIKDLNAYIGSRA